MNRVYSSFSELLQSSEILPALESKKIIRNFIDTSEKLSKLLKTSKGRDKICGVFQYLSDFCYVCNKHSNIYDEKIKFLNGELLSGLIAYRLKTSFSQVRKVFRLFKFIGVLGQIRKILDSKKTSLLKGILTFSHIFSFFYYILDNALWFMNVGILKGIIDENFVSYTKGKKNLSSLFKVIVHIFTCGLFYFLRDRKELKMVNLLLKNSSEKKIEIKDDTYDICHAILRQRQKKRWEILDLVLSFIRIIMLMKSLKIKSLNPIFISLLGLFSSTLSLYKLINKDSKSIKHEILTRTGSDSIENNDMDTFIIETSKKRILRSSSNLLSAKVLKTSRSQNVIIEHETMNY